MGSRVAEHLQEVQQHLPLLADRTLFGFDPKYCIGDYVRET